MKVDLPLELWEAIIVAIDNDLNEFKDCGTEGHPELDIRYGKMLQARGEILCARQGVENICMKGKKLTTPQKYLAEAYEIQRRLKESENA